MVKVTSVRSGQPAINANEYKNYELKLPSLKEQEKIVFFLSHVDKKIDLLETKKELLQTYKKGMLQQLFSQNLRFKDDAGNCYPNWNHLNFDKIFKSISTRKYQIKSSEILDIGKIAVIDQGKEKIAGYSNETLKKFVDIPVIVYGDHTTNLKYAENEFIVGADGIKLLKSKIESNLKYLFYCLYYFNIEPEGYKRHFNILRNVNLPLPFLSEQIKIADFLTSIDKKIDYVDKELQIDREFKKGLLERMFC